MSRAEIEAGLKSHDRALYIKEGWIRDPYIILGPDDYFYLTGTTPNPRIPREKTDPYNIGLGRQSVVGTNVQVWRSQGPDRLGIPRHAVHPRRTAGTRQARATASGRRKSTGSGERWALVHCPGKKANFALTRAPELKGPWTHPMGDAPRQQARPVAVPGRRRHLVDALAKHADRAAQQRTSPTSPPSRCASTPPAAAPMPLGRTNRSIGHEGATMRKIGDKYVHFGTAWSTDQGRKGSYNLYYCTADKITGPYGPRKFAGRFLGHGTPFQTRDGKWWCTAFFNANVPPLPREGIETRDLCENAQTINQRGTTIVPLEVKILDDGDIHIRAKDPAYATPGPDEVQKFCSGGL